VELDLTSMDQSRGIELFVRNKINKRDRFPQIVNERHLPAISASLVKANAILEVTTIKTIQQTILVRG